MAWAFAAELTKKPDGFHPYYVRLIAAVHYFAQEEV
jgi:hypothetical protein